MAAAVPNTDITAMLGSLMEIICKYEDRDPENPPNEGDYLLAMNTLKALNDRKTTFSSVQRQVVVQIRERIRRVPNLLEITTRHAGWMMKKLMEYVSCDVCGSQLANEYALNRHKKRASCREMKARVFFFSPKFQARVAKWSERGFSVDFPFVAALFLLHNEAQPKIMVLPDAREFVWPQQMIPRRILPHFFWESIWSTTAQSVNPRYAFKYDPNMFCYTMKRDGTKGYGALFRHSVITQSERIHIMKVEEQLRTATLYGQRPNWVTGDPSVPRTYERWNLHHTDREPLLKMSVAPNKRPRFKNVPDIINRVAGANPQTSFLAELTNFSTILPEPAAIAPANPGLAAEPVPPVVGDGDGDEDSDSDGSVISLNV